MLFPVVEVTRSLSNLIKYPFVNMQGKEAVVISYEEKDSFVPLKESTEVIFSGTEAEVKEADETPESAKEEPETSLAEEATQQAEWILTEAREQAGRIRQEAEKEAQILRQEAQEEGRNIGREEGLAVAEEELGRIRADLEASRLSLEQEHNRLVSEMETQYVEVLCDLVRKITGVLLRDKKDVLLHLIRSSFSDIQPSNHYTLRVSSEDLTMVENHLDEILMNVESGVSLDVKEEKGLEKNECIIETDTQMVDCGFRTQLDNLITTLHMLVQ